MSAEPLTSARIFHESIEALAITVKATSDPTGTTPQIAARERNSTAAISGYSDGSWGAWDSVASTATVTSPTMGATGAGVVLEEGKVYDLFLKVGTKVDPIGEVRCY